MNMFKMLFKRGVFRPSYPEVPWTNMAIFGLCSVIIGLYFEADMMFYVAAFGLGFSVFFFFLFKERYYQVKTHNLLKAIGIQNVWAQYEAFSAGKQRPDTPLAFIQQYEATMNNPKFREEIQMAINNAEWICVTDTFLKPHQLRWELHAKLPLRWKSDEKLAFYCVMLSCIPGDHVYDLTFDDTKMVLKGDTFFASKFPKDHRDVPEASLRFWLYVQKNMQRLLDLHFMYNTPSMRQGLASNVTLSLPSSFTLSSGDQLHVSKTDNGIEARTISQGKQGPVQTYSTENDFWAVWRNAIEQNDIQNP